MIDLDSALDFITSGQAGPGGRPISLLTFLPHAGNWRSEVDQIRQTNIFIHLSTGLLVFALIWQTLLLDTKKEIKERAFPLAALATALWVSAPINALVGLQEIQRMTLLAAFFVLLGSNLYVYGRTQLLPHPRIGLVWMAIGLAIGSGLGVLAKENAALLPLFLWILETHVSRRKDLPQPPRWCKWALIIIPSLIVIGALAARIPEFLSGFQYREFSVSERLYTQTRVTVDYLKVLLLPSPSQLGYFHDDYVISRGLWQPPSTLFSMLFILGLAITAWMTRNRIPWITLATAWFFVGHLIESTIIPLEIYFLHRNYIPSVFLFGLIAFAVGRSTRNLRRPLYFAMTAYILLGLFNNYQYSTASQNPLLLAELTIIEHPKSVRSAQAFANQNLAIGRPYVAYYSLLNPVRNGVPSASLILQMLIVQCTYANQATPNNVIQATDLLAVTRIDNSAGASLRQLLKLVNEGRCAHLSLPDLNLLYLGLTGDDNRPIHPRNELILVQAGAEIAISYGDSRAALDRIQEIAEDQLNLQLFTLKAHALIQGREFIEAEQAISQIIKHAPKNPFQERKWKKTAEQLGKDLINYIGSLEKSIEPPPSKNPKTTQQSIIETHPD